MVLIYKIKLTSQKRQSFVDFASIIKHFKLSRLTNKFKNQRRLESRLATVMFRQNTALNHVHHV